MSHTPPTGPGILKGGMQYNETDKALRYNAGKPDWTLVHMASLIPMIQVLEFGKNKYTRENWKKPMDRNTILASAQRHLAALIDGEENDPESGLPHIGHLLANGLFYSYHYANKEIPNGVPPREEIVRGISGLG